MDIKENAKKLFYENGIYVDLDDKEEKLELDSLSFISLIISIEEIYSIEVPIEMMQYEKWANILLIEENIKTISNNHAM